MAGREVDHDRRVVVGERDEVAAVRDLVGPELDAHRRGLDRRATGVVAGGVEAEDRHVADVAARREPGRDDRGPADVGARRERGEARHARGFERRAVAELGQRDVGATVGNEHDVLHRRASYGVPRRRPVACRACVARASSLGARRAASSVRSRSPRAAAGRRRRPRRPSRSRRRARHRPRRPRPRRRRRATRRRTTDAPPRPTSPRVHVDAHPGRVRVSTARSRSRGARTTRTCSSPSRPGRVRVVDANGQLSPTPVAHRRSAVARQRGGPPRHHVLARRTKLYVDYTDPGERHARRRVHDARRGRASRRRGASCSSIAAAVLEPQGRRGRSPVPTGCSTSASATAAARTTRNHIGPEPRHAARRRSCASIPPRARASPYSVPADNPFVGRAGVAARDVDVGAAQPVALLVRPRDRRPVDRRRRPGQLRGDRLRARRRRRAINWGWSAREGLPRVHGARRRAARAIRCSRSTHSDGNCAVVGGYVYRGTRDPGARRRVRVRRRLPPASRRRRRTRRTRGRATRPRADGLGSSRRSARTPPASCTRSRAAARSTGSPPAEPCPRAVVSSDAGALEDRARRCGDVIACGVTAEKLPSTLFAIAGDDDRAVLGEAVEPGASRPPARSAT